MDTYKIAAIDVHKSMLAVVVTDAAVEGELPFERRRFGTLGSDLKALAEWLAAQQVQEVVMESTAQYWKPVWRQLEGQCQLHLAQAHSNRARKGRKDDFRDAERLARRHLSGELILVLSDRRFSAFRRIAQRSPDTTSAPQNQRRRCQSFNPHNCSGQPWPRRRNFA